MSGPDGQIESDVDAARGGDEEAFARLVERFRPELRLHCYRLLGSYEDADDVTQDVIVQMWRALPRFEGRSTLRTWLYRIATRACLARHRRDRHRRSLLATTTVMDGVVAPIAATVPWLQAVPDTLLDDVASRDPDPASGLVARETIELAFVAALQHLSDRQRAVVVLRDVVGWSAKQCAAELDTTVASVNSTLARGRRTLRDVLGPHRTGWTTSEPSPHERALLRRYVAAIEAGDDVAIAALLRHDAIVSHQPFAGDDEPEIVWYQGRETILAGWAPALHGLVPLDLRCVGVWVNRQPAVASYARLPGTTEHRAFGLAVLHLHDDLVVEVVNLTADRFGVLGLPDRLPPEPTDDPTNQES